MQMTVVPQAPLLHEKEVIIETKKKKQKKSGMSIQPLVVCESVLERPALLAVPEQPASSVQPAEKATVALYETKENETLEENEAFTRVMGEPSKFASQRKVVYTLNPSIAYSQALLGCAQHLYRTFLGSDEPHRITIAYYIDATGNQAVVGGWYEGHDMTMIHKISHSFKCEPVATLDDLLDFAHNHLVDRVALDEHYTEFNETHPDEDKKVYYRPTKIRFHIWKHNSISMTSRSVTNGQIC